MAKSRKSAKDKPRDKSPRSWRKTLAFSFAFILLSAVFVEIALRLAIPLIPFNRVQDFFDSAALRRLSFVNAHKNMDMSGYRTNYDFIRFDPERGWAVQANARDVLYMEDGKTNPKKASSNSIGLRGEREFALVKPKGVKRIAVFGDSFTFGDGVNDDETFAAQMQKRMPAAEIMNFGVSGYGQDQMLLYLKSDGVKYRPDTVVLAYSWCDDIRNTAYFRDYAKPMFELENGSLKLTHVPVPTPQDLMRKDWMHLRLIDVFDIFSFALENNTQKQHRKTNKLLAKILGEFAETVRSINARPIFVYLPLFKDPLVPTSMSEDGTLKTNDYDAFFPLCAKLKVDCFSLIPAFAKALKSDYMPMADTHWTKEEHAIAGEAIANHLKELGN